MPKTAKEPHSPKRFMFALESNPHTPVVHRLLTKEPMTVAELSAILELDSRTVMAALEELRRDNRVVKDDRLMNDGKWRAAGIRNEAHEYARDGEARLEVRMGSSLGYAERL